MSKEELIELIRNVATEITEIRNVKAEIDNIKQEYFSEGEGRKKFASEMTDLKSLASATVEQLNQQKEQVNVAHHELIGEHSESKKTQFINQLSVFNSHYEDAIAKHEHLLNSARLILEGVDGNPSIHAQLIELSNRFNEIGTEYKQVLDEVKTFHSNVFTDGGLKGRVESMDSELKHLIAQANDKLYALTDSALHSSFATRAESHTKEYHKLSAYTFRSVLAIASVTLVFGLTQLINILGYEKPFNYHLVYYQLGITLPLIYIAWMYNRNQKIAKKLAEEYHHKAALSEAMTGYRNMYQLKHGDEEYLQLFNHIKEQLNVNPSSKIDKFLSLKSPHEKVAGLIDTDTLNKIVEAVIQKMPK